MVTNSSVKRAITRFDKAAQAFAWKGSTPPEMWSHTDKEYKASREALEKLIFSIMEKP